MSLRGMLQGVEDVRWCANCLSMSTRPRISFDARGWCNACRWTEKKKELDWDSRMKELNKLLNRHRSESGHFDCIVPVSGGKDGSYVAYKLKKEFNMNPLCVTVTPPLPLELGEKNLRAFVQSGYDHMSVNPSSTSMQVLNKTGFMEMGFPYYGWLTAIQTIPLHIARKFGINLVFYGEDGEVEYGGSSDTETNAIYDEHYMQKVYLENGHEKVLKNSGLSYSETQFFRFPKTTSSTGNKLEITHWSYYENWDPYRNYLVAKKQCGLMESKDTNSGTFTNFAQNDQALYALHTYLMYLKFGFGRANQDACIEIRRGAMDRDQALHLVRLYDGKYPEEYISLYLDYYQMNENEFNEVLDKWANKNLFEKKGGRWISKFAIK